MKQPIFTGVATAIITPFKNSEIDLPSFTRLLDFQLENKADAIVVCGTTGEASTMTARERLRLVEHCVEYVNGRIPVIAGSGANCTETAHTMSRDMESVGADALLIVTPYYNKATQQGLIDHYTTIADSVEIPIILYNVPSRTGVSFTAETYAALAKHPNIIGTKEASGSFALVQQTRTLCPEDFYIWSGNDEDTACLCTLGAKGVISVAGNIIPEKMHDLTEAALANDLHRAGKIQLKLNPLLRALFCEVNPICVKTALALMGYCTDEFRLPLCRMQEKNLEYLCDVLRQYELIA